MDIIFGVNWGDGEFQLVKFGGSIQFCLTDAVGGALLETKSDQSSSTGLGWGSCFVGFVTETKSDHSSSTLFEFKLDKRSKSDSRIPGSGQFIWTFGFDANLIGSRGFNVAVKILGFNTNWVCSGDVGWGWITGGGGMLLAAWKSAKSSSSSSITGAERPTFGGSKTKLKIITF